MGLATIQRPLLDVDHTEPLARDDVPVWIAYIREQCGWLDCWWGAGTVPGDRQHAARAQAADIRYERAKATGAD